LDYGNPDFIKYAEAYGAKGYRIQLVDELVPRLRQCLDDPSGGIHLIEVPVNYAEGNLFLNKHLKEITSKLL